jgi:GNAT superfamily N-acetyltransferase
MGTTDTSADSQGLVRHASADDRDGVAGLAAELAMSFTFSPEKFRVSYPALLAEDGACLLVAVSDQEHLGYLLGFRHLTFYANGPVAWVEEIAVRERDRGRGIGRALMSEFEQWAAAQECALIALATRRAAPFYRALGYEESATYFRKIPGSQAR